MLNDYADDTQLSHWIALHHQKYNAIRAKSAFSYASHTHAISINQSVSVYYHVAKCGSSSISVMIGQLQRKYGFESETIRPLYDGMQHLKTTVQCGFTFVRDPLHRLISAYYTIHV